jgi:hypothetical protein
MIREAERIREITHRAIGRSAGRGQNPGNPKRSAYEFRIAHDGAASRMAGFYAVVRDPNQSGGAKAQVYPVASAIGRSHGDMDCLIVVYQLVKALLPQNVGSDAFAMLFVCCAVGTVVTWLARKYDIAKRGWLGLGAKANLWLGLVCLVLLPGGILAISYFR